MPIADFMAATAGGGIAAILIAAQHTVLAKRLNLKRLQAYGLLSLSINSGLLAYLVLARHSLWFMAALMVIQAMAGGAIWYWYKIAPLFDHLTSEHGAWPANQTESQELRQQIDTLQTELAAAHREIEQWHAAYPLSITSNEVLDAQANLLTALDDLTKVQASIEASGRKLAAIQAKKRRIDGAARGATAETMARARAGTNKKAGGDPASGS